eukprot:5684432-Amphidinium_carterae.1
MSTLARKHPTYVTADMKSGWQTELLEKLEEAVCEDPGSRTVKIVYRGIPIEVQLSSIEEQAQLCIASFVKTLAVETGALEGLPGELAVVPRKDTSTGSSVGDGEKWTFSKECLVEYSAGRELATTLCASTFTGTEVTTMLKKRQQVLLQADACFKVDLAFLSSLSTSTGVTLLAREFETILESHDISNLSDAVPAFSRTLEENLCVWLPTNLQMDAR